MNKDHLKEIVTLLDTEVYSMQSPGLLDGIAGVSLLFAYYGNSYELPSFNIQAAALLEHAIDVFEQSPNLDCSFASGLTGIAWTIQHLQHMSLVDIDGEELLLSLDQKVFEYSEKLLILGFYDYLHEGLGGIIYLFERSTIGNNTYFLKVLLKHLLKSAEKTDEGIAWASKFSGDLGYNLSVSHGLIGILFILSLYKQHDIQRHEVEEAALQVKNFLYKAINPSSVVCRVPSFIYNDNKQHEYTRRTAWCYGDLGSSLVMHIVGERFEWNDMQELAYEMAIQEAKKRSPDESLIRDACLCHGFSGAAYLFSKWNQRVNLDAFQAAAMHWHNKTVDSVVSPSAWKDYKFWHGGQVGWSSNVSLLEGLCGIGLYLLTTSTDLTPHNSTWDRILLLS